MASVARGDHGALEQLYDRYEVALYSLGMRALSDHQKAEELVQDTVTKVWRGAATYDDSMGSVRSWMFTIARRTAVDIYRRGRRAPTPVEEIQDTPGLDNIGDEVWEAWEMATTLARLPDDQRSVVELVVLKGHTHAEAANQLGIPLGTVKTRVYGGLKALRTHLQSVEMMGGRS